MMLDSDFKKLLDSIKDPHNRAVDLWPLYLPRPLRFPNSTQKLPKIELSDKQVIELAEILKKDTKILELDLSYTKISKIGFLALAEMLQVNTTLQQVKLNAGSYSPPSLNFAKVDRDLGDVLPIIKALETNQSIKMIFLEGCNLQDKGAEALRKVFETNKTLQQVDLADNHIGSLGGSAIALGLIKNTEVFYLNLQQNRLEDAYHHFEALFPQNTRLWGLYLDNFNDKTREIVKRIYTCTNRIFSERDRFYFEKEQKSLKEVASMPKPAVVPEPKPSAFNMRGFSPGDRKSKVEQSSTLRASPAMPAIAQVKSQVETTVPAPRKDNMIVPHFRELLDNDFKTALMQNLKREGKRVEEAREPKLPTAPVRMAMPVSAGVPAVARVEPLSELAAPPIPLVFNTRELCQIQAFTWLESNDENTEFQPLYPNT